MTPASRLSGTNLSGSQGASSSLYNNYSNTSPTEQPATDVPDNTSQNPDPTQQIADKLTPIVNGFMQLSQSFPDAEPEAQKVATAIAEWLNKVVNLSNAQTGSPAPY